MRRGPWHQFGDRSQRQAIEQLQRGVGVGVILSARDLAYHNAAKYAETYRDLGAEVIFDQQFYVPDFSNSTLQTYPISNYRVTASSLRQINDREMAGMQYELENINREIQVDALLAPAIVYEAGRSDIEQLNARLFAAAKQVGNVLGVPTYATIMLGRSVTSSEELISTTLSSATTLDSDGWYFGFEFNQERIPSSREAALRCCVAGLTLACTGKPVLHSYAGPLALLSMGFGATGVGIGHAQNLWQFTRERWQPSNAGSGGGGDAPPRFFSGTLWGTIVYPDEIVQLPAELRHRVFTPSPFSPQEAKVPPDAWDRWSANKHLVHLISTAVKEIAKDKDPRKNVAAATEILIGATTLHEDIRRARLTLGDNTSVYQANWLAALNDLVTRQAQNFDYLALLAEIN
jgi:hypothetical protein